MQMVELTFNYSLIVQSVERRPWTLITSALKDSRVSMTHANGGIIRDSEEHDPIVSVYRLACSAGDFW